MIVNYKRMLTSDQDSRKQLQGIRCDKEFIDISNNDKHISKRSQLNKMLRTISKGDTVFVESFNILAPSMRDLASILQKIILKGASIKFEQERVEVAKTSYNFFGFLNLMTQFEHQKAQEKIHEGQLKAAGLRQFGIGHRKLSLVQTSEIKKLHASGTSAEKLAKQYNVSRFTIYNIIKNKVKYAQDI